jgi:hypothetical protein
VDILVTQGFTEVDAKKADLKRAEYRKSRATSEVSNLLNFVDLKKSVVLCESHVRRFNLKSHGYRLHPTYSRVNGMCDVCQQLGPGRMFQPEAEWLETMKRLEQIKRDREYASIVF